MKTLFPKTTCKKAILLWMPLFIFMQQMCINLPFRIHEQLLGQIWNTSFKKIGIKIPSFVGYFDQLFEIAPYECSIWTLKVILSFIRWNVTQWKKQKKNVIRNTK